MLYRSNNYDIGFDVTEEYVLRPAIRLDPAPKRDWLFEMFGGLLIILALALGCVVIISQSWQFLLRHVH